MEGSFNESNILKNDCNTTLNDLKNLTIEKLDNFAVLTSQPQVLSPEQVSAALASLEFLEQSFKEEEVLIIIDVRCCLLRSHVKTAKLRKNRPNERISPNKHYKHVKSLGCMTLSQFGTFLS